MKENGKNTGLTRLERKIIGACFDGIPKTNQQIADLIGSTEGSVKSTRVSLKRKGIIAPVKNATPVKDLIIFQVWQGAETISELAEVMDISRYSIKQAIYSMRRVVGIRIPLKRSESTQEKE